MPRGGVEQMNPGQVALAPARGGDPARAADVERLDREPLALQPANDQVQPEAVAADQHEVRRTDAPTDELDLDRGAAGHELRLAWHGDEPVGLAERGDAAGALGSRVGGEARLGLDQRDHEKLGPAALGCRADREGRGHGFPFVRRQAGHGPDQGSHEGMKGNDR